MPGTSPPGPGDLTREQAAYVDAAVAESADGRISSTASPSPSSSTSPAEADSGQSAAESVSSESVSSESVSSETRPVLALPTRLC